MLNRPRPVFRFNRDGQIAGISSTYAGVSRQRNFFEDVGNAFNIRNPVETVAQNVVDDVGKSISDWFVNNGVNIIFVIIGLIMVLSFVLAVAK